MSINTTHEFCPADRYIYDFGICSTKNGFAQIDTEQDASYYGNWCNPFKRVAFSYVEGDCYTTVCDTDEDFVTHLRSIAKWNTDQGFEPIFLDPGFNEELKAKLAELGLDDLLYRETSQPSPAP